MIISLLLQLSHHVGILNQQLLKLHRVVSLLWWLHFLFNWVLDMRIVEGLRGHIELLIVNFTTVPRHIDMSTLRSIWSDVLACFVNFALVVRSEHGVLVCSSEL